MKNIISIILSALIVISIFTIVPFESFAAENSAKSAGVQSGTTGDCTWTLNDNGVLTISGNGFMDNSSLGYDSPWKNENFTKVINLHTFNVL